MALLGTPDIDFDKEAWDKAAYFDFRDQLFFDALCDVKPGEQSTPGSTVKFTFVDDLAVATTPLNEKQDVTPVTTTDSNVTLTLAEYGNAVRTTRFLREFSFIPLDPVVAEVLGYNAGVSLDTLARDAFLTGTNVTYGGDATDRDEVINTDVLTSAMVRRQVAALRGDNVPGFGGYYMAIVHPDVSVDLREETGAAGWRIPQDYGSSQERIYNGEIGVYEGVRFMEAPRAKTYEGGGGGTTAADVYTTIFLGRQAIAKGYAPAVGARPTTVPGPVTDTLRRFVPMGWYWIGGYKVFREESLRRIETGSSIDTDYAA